MDLALAGRVALVTGASRGIGLATAQGFAAEGCHLVISARNPEELAAATEKLRRTAPSVTTVVADATAPEQAQALVDAAVAAHGGIDVLVNNVGGGGGGRRIMTSTDEEWRATLEINLMQTVRMMRLAAPHMAGREGAVVNIASISGWSPRLSSSGQYGAAKAALIYNTELWALDLGEHGIRVNTVSPGSILTEGNGWDRYRIAEPAGFADYVAHGFPMGRLGTVEEVADVVVFIASKRAHWINGRNIPVDGLEQPHPAPGRRPW